MQNTQTDYKVRSYLFSGSIVYLLFCLLGRVVRFGHSKGFVLAADSIVPITISSLLALSLLIFSLAKKERISSLFNSLIFLLGLALLLFTDFIYRPFMFIDKSGIRAPLIVTAAVGLFLFSSWRSLDDQSRIKRIVSLPTLLLVQLAAAVFFIRYTDGRLLFNDDHPSFLYRFQLLLDAFPAIPFYNTDWNAGYSAREFFPSGILNVFFFFWPFLYFGPDIRTFDGVELYNWVIPVVFLFVVPLSVYWASRRWGLSSVGATVAALCAFGPSFSYFEWLLRYGTLGFACSMGLIPLALVFATELGIDEHKPKWSTVAALLIVASCCLAWTLSAFVFLPAVFLTLYYYWSDGKTKDVVTKPRLVKVLVFSALFLALNGPWLTIFVQESKVFSFVSGQTMPGSETRSVHGLADSAKNATKTKPADDFSVHYSSLQRAIGKLNPVLVLLFLPGVLLIRERRRRAVLLMTVVWLLVVALIGDYLKPQLELRRMVIPAAFLMCLPAGRAMEAFFTRAASWTSAQASSLRFAGYVLCGLLFSIVALSPANAISHYLNRAHQHYRFAPEAFKDLTLAIKEHGGEGRVLFSGFILHDFGAENYASQDGGHIAPLAHMSGKELYASDFYHSRWSTVDPIPASYRKRGESGIEEFLDLVNVTAVVAFKREWVEYFESSPKYEEKFSGRRFRLYSRKASPGMSMIYRGSGEVFREDDGFLIRPNSSEVVVRYRYHPRLVIRPEGVATLFKEPAFVEDVGAGKTEEVYFVGVKFLSAPTPVKVGFSPNP